MTTRDICQALRNKQSALNESDGPFAQRLGVDRETWRKIRVGQAMPTRRTLEHAAAAFPDLLPDIMALFVPRDVNILATVREESTPEPAEARS